MCMGPDITHVKGQGCLGGQGKYSNEGDDGQNLESWRDFTRRRERPRRRLRHSRRKSEARHVYGAGLETAHLRVESSWTPSCRGLAPIGPWCADMLWRVEAAVLSISDAFDQYMRRAVMGTSSLIASPPASAADSEVPAPEVPIRSSSTPSPSIRALDTDDNPCPQ
ncbi:hypothetical protein M9H77_08124 [Catharanthus roseus]|uniref:Uncharacterized protein n=1 Tax=Catharanthus roseus TaxID=4058 RepID=A0ACC0BX69_CATRO|nr:hypothetical protein M9H77_08124 [Catharanthus roseus]